MTRRADVPGRGQREREGGMRPSRRPRRRVVGGMSLADRRMSGQTGGAVAADAGRRRRLQGGPNPMTAVDLLLSSATPAHAADLAHTIASALDELGWDATVLVDELPAGDGDRLPLVVGPDHVLAHLVDGDRDAVDRVLRRAVVVSCEPPGTTAWTASLPYAARAAAVLDISDGGVAAFGRHGVTAERLTLGYAARLDRRHGEDAARPVDVLVLGEADEGRATTISRAAEVLSRHDVDIRLVRPGSVRTLETLDPDARRDLFTASKVLFVAHGDDRAAFPWPDAVDALCNGCVLIAEESADFGPLRAGRHFLTGGARSLPLLLDRALADPALLDGIRAEAHRFLREELPLAPTLERLLRRAAARPRNRGPVRGAGHREPTMRDDSASGTTPPTLPKPLLDAVSKQNAVLKKLALDLRGVRREVSHMSRLMTNPDAPMLVTTRTPAQADPDVAVSVVVTVHNYARFVGEALESVARSEGVKLEIVVIDDASIDGSAEVVRDFMRDHADIPVTLLEQRLNTGVQRARNTALSMCRAPTAFILDADNQVYPRGIAKLADALHADPAAGFAYGIIERFDAGGSIGLMGTEAWSPTLLAHEHYIDAMALVRIDAWKQVGGYVTDPSLEVGWEDYDLWLSFAGAGLHGVHVREIVARYRIHGVSALTVTALDTADLMARLRQRHPDFFARRQVRSA